MRGADVPGPPMRTGPTGPPPLPGEPDALARTAAAGLPLAPIVWVPEEAEEAFYRLNALPRRLADLFDGIASRDPDEDEVEEAAAEARALISGHTLLDAWVDVFHEAVATLPPRLRVRRPGAAGRTAGRGRPALLALRATWAEAWDDDAVLARLRATGSVALEAAPVLLHGAEDEPAPDELARRVRSAAGEELAVRCDGQGRVTRLGSAARPEPEEGGG